MIRLIGESYELTDWVMSGQEIDYLHLRKYK